jgi:PAS domain S-box-containing protein
MSKAKILIVEDELVVAEDLSQKLCQLGYEVVGVTGSGKKSVALAREIRPGLVLMDIRLEGEMDGVEAAGKIRQECDLPVVYLTAHSDPTTLQRTKVTEPYGYILKPFEERDLETHIQMALYKHAADRDVRRHREWLQVTLQSIGDAVITTDAAGKVTSLNPVAEELTGWKLADALGHPLTEVFNIINEHTRKPAPHPVERVLSEGKVVGLANHTALISRGGQQRAIEDSAAPIKDSQGRISGVVMVFHDVTEKRRAEVAQARLAAIVESSQDAIISKSLEGTILTWNPSAEKLFGYAAPEAIGKPMMMLIPPERGAEEGEILSRMQAGQATEHFETVRVAKDGRRIDVSVTLSPIRNAEGKIVALSKIARDITVQKEAQAVLARGKEELERLVAERTAKLEELVGELEHFSYTITHDMRAPLRGMQGFAEMMADACEGCVKHDPTEFLRRIQTSGLRMDALITDALNYSKAVRQELPLEPVDAAALLRGILDSYPEFQRAKAKIEIRGEIPLVMGNQAGLTQCFSNLLGNAVKFVKPGQKPEIGIWAEVVRNGDRAEWVRVYVEDQGIGIPGMMLPRVFDMFSRASKSYEGTGIGLALVRKVMDRMGGRVGVESEEGKGSRFWLDLRSGDRRVKASPQPGGGPKTEGA